ncbi:MAG: hypothetical protein SFY95_05900 [Planctomycetota bacterium]|nr:hypothetical protein [Planctomycetota bacterium]
MKTTITLLAAASIAGSAFAGTQIATNLVNLYGTNYSVASFNVISDVGLAGTSLQPEGMTFYNGTLYVAGDRDNGETRGSLVAYAGGNLASPTRIALGQALDSDAGSNQNWGPEGITVNTSGSGYGSFSSGPGRLAGVEGAGRDRAGVINLSDGSVTDLVGNAPQVFGNFDDLAFSASADAFFAVDGDLASSPLVRLNKFTLAVEATIVANWGGGNAKGLTVVSKAFAELLTGASILTDQAFIAAIKDGTGPLGVNRLVVADLNGNIIGSQQGFNLTGLGSRASEIEAIAVDEATGRIFVGDEGTRTIHVLTIPAPSALALLGVAGLAGARRRR